MLRTIKSYVPSIKLIVTKNKYSCRTAWYSASIYAEQLRDYCRLYTLEYHTSAYSLKLHWRPRGEISYGKECSLKAAEKRKVITKYNSVHGWQQLFVDFLVLRNYKHLKRILHTNIKIIFFSLLNDDIIISARRRQPTYDFGFRSRFTTIKGANNSKIMTDCRRGMSTQCIQNIYSKQGSADRMLMFLLLCGATLRSLPLPAYFCNCKFAIDF